ncbi:CDP-glycerol glycerophosphotransferase family protein [Shewanella sp. NIFS-20-20]|uniref:CDP-glycerol glycerophosphotransferase family protein n=1 Tax=Shewanella sp. NIFS-20-20 TaxID=2853806 RepID=UPI001C45AAE1|nr:CDP-glycerol glycerophosphotransferase family protein [Shewanella sp. NIFS-20-20]MBV7316383.1 CDP-glycerol glycerophosphotransferase family protein [Shewanella sp. NIFS-20-20]
MTLLAKGQAIYIAPANPAGRALMARLSGQFSVSGLVDNLKQGDGIFPPTQVVDAGAKIVIAAGGFQGAVITGLLAQGLTAKSLLIEDEAGQLQPYRRPWLDLNALRRNTYIRLLGYLRRLPWRLKRVYYAEAFVDTNVMLTFAAHRALDANAAVLVVDKDSAIPSGLRGYSFESQPLRALWHMVFARSFVIDHEYQSLTFTTLRRSVPVVQLWHGLPYKQITGNSHYPNINDACFISSSTWFNQQVFAARFNAEDYLALGYPRNDVFFQSLSQRCWLNSEPLPRLREVQAQSGELIIYAPTFRDNQHNDYPLDLVAINQWCQQHQCAFILKFHPFIYRLMAANGQVSASDSLVNYPNLEHVYIFPNGKNVYPWLAEAKMLVTDYSSMAFDFMLSAKTIVYYQYDKEEYQQVRGQPLIGDQAFIQGEVACNMPQLLTAMSASLETANVEYRAIADYNSQEQACVHGILKAIDKIEGQGS